MAAVSAQRLSALSTNTLTAVLELTRHSQLQVKPPQSLLTKINKNLAALRSGIIVLHEQTEGGFDATDPIIRELERQYGRLLNLTDGLGVEAQPLELSQPSTPTVAQGRLIDDDSVFGSDELPQAHLPRTQTANTNTSQLIPHTTIQMEARAALERENDEEMPGESAQDVMQMQKRMIDNETLSQLSTAIARQRDLSNHISDELEVHNRLLDETDTAIDRTESSLMRAGRRLEQVSRRHAQDNSATCIILGLIIVLVLLIAILNFEMYSANIASYMKGGLFIRAFPFGGILKRGCI